MIDVRELKTRYEEIRKNIENRFMNVDLDKIVSDQEKRAALMQETESKITAAMQQEQAAERDITVPMNDIAAAYRRESVTGMDDGRYTMLAAGMYRQMLGERD